MADGVWNSENPAPVFTSGAAVPPDPSVSRRSRDLKALDDKLKKQRDAVHQLRQLSRTQAPVPLTTADLELLLAAMGF